MFSVEETASSALVKIEILIFISKFQKALEFYKEKTAIESVMFFKQMQCHLSEVCPLSTEPLKSFPLFVTVGGNTNTQMYLCFLRFLIFTFDK